MLIHLLVIIVFWFSSSAGESEVSGSASAHRPDGEGQLLMRLRPCQDDARIQCDLCEVIRIIDTEAYASNPEHQTNSIECSDVNVHEVIDCPENSVYLDEIARNCNGTQTCELNCSSLVNTESCCVEISYTCEQREGVTLSDIFVADDSSGNVASVSLRCQSSDLSVDSVVLAFNSPEEFQDGGICYRLSTNMEYVSTPCYGTGCSNIQIPGERGCGGNSAVYNTGAYIYYICDHSRQNQCQRLVPTVQITNEWPISMVMMVISVLVLVVAVMASFVAGFIVGLKRRRKMLRVLQTRAAEPKTSPCATRETPDGEVSEGELERHTYQEISSIILENSPYCEIKEVEIIVKQEKTEPWIGKDNRATRKTDELAGMGRVSAYTALPGKLESKQTTDDFDTGGISSTAVYALETHPIPDPKLVYDEVNQSSEAQTFTSTEVDFLKQYINPVYETVDESNTHTNPDCKGPAQTKNVGKSVYSNSDTPRRDSKPL